MTHKIQRYIAAVQPLKIIQKAVAVHMNIFSLKMHYDLTKTAWNLQNVGLRSIVPLCTTTPAP